ncbi:MAG: glycosyltransferase family protein [Patescibacteria group bacterium]
MNNARTVDYFNFRNRTENTSFGAAVDIAKSAGDSYDSKRMAHILYGICGQGSGHAMRAKEILAYLTSHGHQVHLVTYGQGEKLLAPHYPTTLVTGLHLNYQGNEVQYTKTVVENALKLPEFLRDRERIATLAEDFQPEIVITDFEPVTAAIAHRYHLPLLSIDNQHFITNTKVTYPVRFAPSAATATTVTRLIVNRADRYLVSSFVDAPIKNPKTTVVPPILRQAVLTAQPTTGDSILVYLTSACTDLLPILSAWPDQFIVYGLNQAGTRGNVVLKPPSIDGFLHDLINCRAVIGTTGFTLVTEAIHLGKPYLGLPVAKQFEQTINAYLLEQAGYGLMAADITTDIINTFVSRLPEFAANLARYPQPDNQATFQAIDRFIAEHGTK